MSDLPCSVDLAISELIEKRTGLSLGTLADGRKAPVVRGAMTRLGTADFGDYLDRLRTDAAAFDDLLSELTVPETYFFRDDAQFAWLRDKVLPELRALRGAGHRLRLWSAGCASGEEAYSLAIVLDQLGCATRAEVLGTDISERALRRARRALYGAWSLRGLPRRLVERYFRPTAEGFQLDDRIARAARFAKHNLACSHAPAIVGAAARFDVILCKNVFIYFERRAAQRAAQTLASLLDTSGWLLLGPSDPLFDLGDLCETVTTSFGICYRRRAPGESILQSTERAIRPLHAPWTPAAPHQAGAEPAPPRRSPAPPAVPSPPSVSPQELTLEAIQACANRRGSSAAEAMCRDLLARDPLVAGAHYVHAVLLLDLRREREAEAALDRALFLDRSLAVAHFMRGLVAARRGDHRAACRAYVECQRFCAQRPPEQPAAFGDGITHRDLGEAASSAVASLLAAEAIA
jgi:chemotaxis protein methyltransferase CheR